MDVNRLIKQAIRLHKEKQFDICHCRSYIPSLAGLKLREKYGVKFLFDMRGFWPEEKVEGGAWPLSNPLYSKVFKYFKKKEVRFFTKADGIVSLTENGKNQILTRTVAKAIKPEIRVIPTCVDFAHFPAITSSLQKENRERLGFSQDDTIVTYLGSIGSWYMLSEMLDFFRVMTQQIENSIFFIISTDPADPILDMASAKGIDKKKIRIQPASRNEVPQFLSTADFGLFFIKPVFSKISSSPTKLGEFLAMNIPVITNTGVGDVDAITRDTKGGYSISEFNNASYLTALNYVLSRTETENSKIRDLALPYYDVIKGSTVYKDIYEEMLSN